MTIPYTKQGAPFIDDPVNAAATFNAAKANAMDQGIYEAQLQPAVRASHNADQSIVTSTWTAVALDLESFDTAGGSASTQHDTVTNNSRLTALYAGKYLATAMVCWAASATGTRYVAIAKGWAAGAPAEGDYAQSASGINVGAGNRMNVTGVFDLAVNEFLQVVVFQDSGSGLAVLGATAATRPQFSMVRVA